MPEHCLLERNPPRVDATLYRIKSAGRTRKGARRQTNCDYICNFEFTARDAEHGFYAVADGSLSTAGGERASEVAIQTLSSAVKASPSGNQIQAITGATISSQSVAGIVNDAVAWLGGQLKGGQGAQGAAQ